MPRTGSELITAAQESLLKFGRTFRIARITGKMIVGQVRAIRKIEQKNERVGPYPEALVTRRGEHCDLSSRNVGWL
jgi:hypothetical protein